MESVELLIHPVRLRIVYALSGGRPLTSAQLLTRLPDVPKATLYRHVALLADGGVLEVVGEQRMRGAVERTYRLRSERTIVSNADARRMSTGEHRQAFSAAMAALLAEFGAYLERPGADPFADGVSYKQTTLLLTPDERAALIDEVRAAIVARGGHEAAPGRTPHLLGTILFPLESPTATPLALEPEPND
jgi:DNA-binding transcriptional ArsR family regulator